VRILKGRDSDKDGNEKKVKPGDGEEERSRRENGKRLFHRGKRR
jgi:hypothetical protein